MDAKLHERPAPGAEFRIVVGQRSRLGLTLALRAAQRAGQRFKPLGVDGLSANLTEHRRLPIAIAPVSVVLPSIGTPSIGIRCEKPPSFAAGTSHSPDGLDEQRLDDRFVRFLVAPKLSHEPESDDQIVMPGHRSPTTMVAG